MTATTMGNVGLTLSGDGQSTPVSPYTDLLTACLALAVQQAAGLLMAVRCAGRAMART